MRPSRVRQRWSQGKPVLCTTNHVTDPSITELISLMGFDCIWIDMEHHATSVETANQMMRAARVGGADVLARPGKGEFMRLGRMLESGAHGIMYPRCDNAEEARQVVRWSKFAPLGERGFDGGNPDMPYCSMSMADYVRYANEQTYLMLQIESPAAVEQSRAIAEVEGVDMLFFGPGDFSVLSGKAGQFDSDTLVRARESVCKAALAAGKRFGTVAFNPEMAKRLLDIGATFLCSGADLLFIKSGLERMREQFAPLGFVFDDDRLSGVSAYGFDAPGRK
jgi:4-hydroxy-2-oxoheptanedioate aldolase